jgi:hypothetical protein
VFNADDGTVEVILVRGDTDFVRVGNCYVSNVCPTTGCRGEDMTRTTVFAAHVPETSDPEDIESRGKRLERYRRRNKSGYRGAEKSTRTFDIGTVDPYAQMRLSQPSANQSITWGERLIEKGSVHDKKPSL